MSLLDGEVDEYLPNYIIGTRDRPFPLALTRSGSCPPSCWVPGFSYVVHGISTSLKTLQEIVSTISVQIFGMVKSSCLEEVGVCVLDGRMGRLTLGARVRNLFDYIRSSREIGCFSGFLDSMGEVDEEEDEDERSRFCNLVDTEDVECLLGTYPLGWTG
ncbi:hypothetical protein ACH5RR_039677 [Cinchona calisaya]|uniref:Uncharacterized protein n=1 Tax=Cinchona calisaya TaxID=153742 RepID=A0ABD2Y490_9GENT